MKTKNAVEVMPVVAVMVVMGLFGGSGGGIGGGAGSGATADGIFKDGNVSAMNYQFGSQTGVNSSRQL